MLPVWLRCSVAALLVASAAGLIYLAADTTSRQALDRDAPTNVQPDLDEGLLTDDEMDRRRQIHIHRSVIRDRAIRELLAGRLTLVQAAAQFRDVEEDHPVSWWPQNAATGSAEGERLCRMVIGRATGWVESHLPSQAAAVAARLVAELEEHRSPDGTVRLPD